MPPLDTAVDSSERGALLPGPGIYGWTFTMGSNPDYWETALPPDGQLLDDFLQQLIAGITNLPPEKVFPLWQPEPAPKPPNGNDWAAVGIPLDEPDPGWPIGGYDPDQKQYYLRHHEEIDLLTVCYGPHAGWYSGLIRDGFRLPQNREILQLAGMGLITVGGGTHTPEFVNQRWLDRQDRHIRLHRVIRRAYPILNLLGPGAIAVAADDRPPIGFGGDIIVEPEP